MEMAWTEADEALLLDLLNSENLDTFLSMSGWMGNYPPLEWCERAISHSATIHTNSALFGDAIVFNNPGYPQFYLWWAQDARTIWHHGARRALNPENLPTAPRRPTASPQQALVQMQADQTPQPPARRAHTMADVPGECSICLDEFTSILACSTCNVTYCAKHARKVRMLCSAQFCGGTISYPSEPKKTIILAPPKTIPGYSQGSGVRQRRALCYAAAAATSYKWVKGGDPTLEEFVLAFWGSNHSKEFRATRRRLKAHFQRVARDNGNEGIGMNFSRLYDSMSAELLNEVEGEYGVPVFPSTVAVKMVHDLTEDIVVQSIDTGKAVLGALPNHWHVVYGYTHKEGVPNEIVDLLIFDPNRGERRERWVAKLYESGFVVG